MPVQPLLSVRGVTVRFGGIVALDRVSFDVGRGTIHGLIGPNGAGKTTLFDVVTRVRRPLAGEVELDGRSLLDVPAHRVVERGLARTFQGVELFPSLTVLENVLVGAHAHGRRARAADAEDVLREVGLARHAGAYPEALSYGARKRVELARALAARPALLLLDEPAAGLDDDEVELLAEAIGRLRDERGATVLLVEHHLGLVMRVCDRVTVLGFGRTIADGPAAAVQRDPAVVEAYLGPPAAPESA